jgi:Txe/YoeB family toxin of toxin-antitoxin system
VDVFDAKADAEAVLAALGAPARVQISRKVADWWHPGRSGAIGLGPNVLATFGEVHPRVLQAMGVKGPAVAFTIAIAAVPEPKAKTPTRAALTLSDLQAVDRDFAFVVDAKVEALTAILAANPFRTPPPYESLVGDLKGLYSRRINIAHRLVYEVLKERKTVKVLRLWTHYGE